MSETFEQLASRRERERAGRVTWRRVSDLTGGGWSGYGPGGRLVFVDPPAFVDGRRRLYQYGTVKDGARVAHGSKTTLAEAKDAAARLIRGRR